jgi:hypothetical protein
MSMIMSKFPALKLLMLILLIDFQDK